MKKTEPDFERDWTTAGIKVYRGSNPSVCLVYKVRMPDGSVQLRHGRLLMSLPGILPAGARMPRNVRADLTHVINAAGILIEQLTDACYELDLYESRRQKKIRKVAEKLRDELKKPTKKKRRKR